MYLVIKRIFDFLLSLVLLLALSPVLIACALVIWLTMGRPVFFRQLRAGKGGKPFRIYKFRSMSDKRGANGALLPDVERLTPFGRFLRRSSLDEVPQLLNVLKGEMSFIGPRPLLMEYLPLYSEYHARRHNVTPGMSGWAQVNGRNAMLWSKKFDCDAYYADHVSFALDAKIFFMTFRKLFFASDNSNTLNTADVDDLHFWDKILAQRAAESKKAEGGGSAPVPPGAGESKRAVPPERAP